MKFSEKNWLWYKLVAIWFLAITSIAAITTGYYWVFALACIANGFLVGHIQTNYKEAKQ